MVLSIHKQNKFMGDHLTNILPTHFDTILHIANILNYLAGH